MSTFVGGLLQALHERNRAELSLISPDRFRGGPGEAPAQLLLAAQQLAQLLRVRPRLVHVHEHPVLLGAAIAYRALARQPIRVVYTIHVDPVERRRCWKRRLLGRLLGRCWAVTAVSKHTAGQLANIATPVPRAVGVIPGGSSIVIRPPDDPAIVAFRNAYGLGLGPILCQIAPLNFPRKVAGVIQLVYALALLRARFPSAQLLLVGDGQLRASVERAVARAGVAEAVVMTGSLDDVSLPLATADIYCQVTFHDACPLSLLEAMRSGKPVVAASAGGINEIVTDELDGVLVPPTPEDIERAIWKLLEDPERARRLGAAAARTARARFTWERVADDFLNVYDHGRPEAD